MKKDIDGGYTEIEFSDTEYTAWIKQGLDSVYLTKKDMQELFIILNNYLNPLTDIK